MYEKDKENINLRTSNINLNNNKKAEKKIKEIKKLNLNKQKEKKEKLKNDNNNNNNDIKQKKEEKEEIIISMDNKNELNNNLISIKPNKTVLKNKKQKKDNPDRIAKNDENIDNNKKEKIDIIEKKENGLNYLISKSKKQNHKKEKSKIENDKTQKQEININNILETKIEIPSEKKVESENERTLLRSNKLNKKREKSQDKRNLKIKRESKDNNKNVEFNNNKETQEINGIKDIIEYRSPANNKKKKKVKHEDKFEEKEKEKEKEKEQRNHKEDYYSLEKRNIDLEKKLQQRLNIINIKKLNNQRDKPIKFETITQYKEKQENKPRSRSKSKSRHKSPVKNHNKNNNYYQSISHSQKSRNKMPIIKIHDKDRDKEENMDMNKNMANISKSQKSIRKKKKISDTKGIMPNPTYQKTSSGLKISDKGLSISHVNDINYLGENNNYLYLKNRIIRFNNTLMPKNEQKEEHKDNNEYYNENEFIGYNLYMNTESDKKRKVMFSGNNNDNDLQNRQRRLEKQKNKLKEELRKAGNGYYSFKINNNPINRKLNKNGGEFVENNNNMQKIKIINKVSHKENERKPILLNKKEKYEKNFNDQYSKMNSIDTPINAELPKEILSPVSVNTKVKNDPLKFITQYYLAKDKLNKITNNKETLEDEHNNEYNKYKNINLLEILKLINESKKNDLENKLSKFKGKPQPIVRKINIHNHKPKTFFHTTDENNINNSLSKATFNNNLKSMDFITESNHNCFYTKLDPNNLHQRSNNYTASKKHRQKRVISLVKNRKKSNESFGNTERRLNSSKRMCRVCNRSYRNNISTENINNSCTLNERYNSHKSNSVCKKIKKVKFN